MTTDQFNELMRVLARIDSRVDAKFAALEHRLTGIEQQLLQRIDEVEETLKTQAGTGQGRAGQGRAGESHNVERTHGH